VSHFDDCLCDDCTYVQYRSGAKVAAVIAVLGVIALLGVVALVLSLFT